MAMKERVAELLAAIDTLVASATGAVEKRLNARLDGIAAQKGDRGDAGPQGDPGQVGKDGAPGADGARGEDGQKGDPGERGQQGERGADGAPGDRGPHGEKGDTGPPGHDGAAGGAGAQGEPGQRGETGIKGDVGERGEKGEPGEHGRDGLEGPAGRDALQLDPVELDPAKKYRKGEWAYWGGGILRSYRATEPFEPGGDLEKAGWRVIVNGVAEVAVEIGGDDLRSVGLAIKMTSGAVIMKSVQMPVVVDRGVWKESAYDHGDGVTWDGCFWIAQRKTLETERPGDSSGAYRLSVKKGRDGRDGIRGEKGDRGAEGRGGKDTTQLGPNGGKW